MFQHKLTEMCCVVKGW